MQNRLPATATVKAWLVATSLAAVLMTCCGCTTNGSGRRGPSVLVVGASRVVHLVEADEPLVMPRPGVWLERGRYLELIELEMAVLAGRLVWKGQQP